MSAWRCSLLALATVTAIPMLATAQSPNCPLDFTATSMSPGSVTFHWSGFGGADAYQVFGFEGQGDTAAYSPMLSGDARSASVSNLASGSYTFWVDAFHTGTVVAESCQQTVSVGGSLAMACPTNLTASAGTSAIGLHWDAVANATAYRIARQAATSPWNDNYATSDTTSYVDANVSSGGTYSYRVITQNTREPPEACAAVTATVPASTSVPFFPTGTSLLLAGVSTAGIVGFVAWRRLT